MVLISTTSNDIFDATITWNNSVGIDISFKALASFLFSTFVGAEPDSREGKRVPPSPSVDPDLWKEFIQIIV